MTQRRVLFLDTHHLTAYRVAGGTVDAEGEFAADPAGIDAFGEYLVQHRDSVFMLLADVAEEGFQLEEIPRCSGRDRAALIKRKLAQFFYGTPLALASSQGRQKTGRRDERLLLMALTRPQHFEPWLATLDAAQVALAGIYSLPQTLVRLLSKDMPQRLLLITLTRGGLRQTFFADGQLRFSRLSTLARSTATESANSVANSAANTAAQEAGKMHQYLLGQRLIERGQPLATRVLVHPDQMAAVRERCRSTADLQFDFIDLLQEARRAGLRTPPADSCADALFCRLLAAKPPAGQFAAAAEREYYRLWQVRSALKLASGLILAAGLVFSSLLGLDILHTQNSIRQIEAQTRRDQQSYDATLQSLPKIPLTTDKLRALVDRYEAVLKRSPGPAPLLIQMSRSLDAFPDIAIERIEWSIAEQLPVVPANVANHSAANHVAAPPRMGSGPYAIANVEARLPIPMAGNQRGQLTRVADFARHLSAAPDTQVLILQQPVDTQSGQTLKSSGERRTLEAPRFSFRLIRKL